MGDSDIPILETGRGPWGNEEFLGNTEGPVVLHNPEFITIPVYLH